MHQTQQVVPYFSVRVRARTGTEMERSTNLCGAADAASHCLCSMSWGQTCLWTTLTKIVVFLFTQ